MIVIPPDVLEAVRAIFADANREVAGRLARSPFYHEPGLDMSLIDAIAKYNAPFYSQYTDSLVQIATHFIGGAPHWGKWEIADVGLIIEVYRFGKLELRKTAVLQSKRLYADSSAADDVDDDSLRTIRGFGGLHGRYNPLPAEPPRSFAFTDDSKYRALEVGGEQFERIAAYESEFEIPVHYMLYNPTDVPLKVTVPGRGYLDATTTNPDGCRILRAETLSSRGKGAPSYGDVSRLKPPHEFASWNAGWRLEDFVVDLCLACHEGRIASENDPGLDALFNRRNGPIASAIAVQIDVRDGV